MANLVVWNHGVGWELHGGRRKKLGVLVWEGVGKVMPIVWLALKALVVILLEISGIC
jgi:hypothetical protein